MPGSSDLPTDPKGCNVKAGLDCSLALYKESPSSPYIRPISGSVRGLTRRTLRTLRLRYPPPPIPSVYMFLSHYHLTTISSFIYISTLRPDPPSDPPCPIRRTLSCSYIHPPFYIHLSYDIYLYYFQNLLQPALE